MTDSVQPELVPTAEPDELAVPPDTPDEGASGDFENPYAGQPELAEAYHAGYLDGAFGSHSDQSPPFEDERLAGVWVEGNRAGQARFAAYRKGFRAGIEGGLVGEEPLAPTFEGTLARAWAKGRDAGLRKAQEVAAALRSKALGTDSFDQPSGRIHQSRPGGAWWYWQEYDGNRRAVFLEAGGEAYAIDEPHYAAYRALGGLPDVLGPPAGDSTPVGDGRGRYATFRRGEIYSTPQTGAHAMRGRILRYWHEHRDELGYPTSDRSDEQLDGGWAQMFERGDVFQWGDTSPISVREVEVRYRGMNCFGVTDGAGQDETYPVITVLGPLVYNPDGGVSSAKTFTRLGAIADADGGGSYPQEMTVYRGRVSDIGGISVELMEHDSGDPDRYRALIEGAVRTTLAAASAAIAATGAGIPVSALVSWLTQSGAGPLASAINDALDTGDDLIGGALFPLTPRTLFEMGGQPRQRAQDIEFHFGDEALISGKGASYKAYFDVVPVG